MAETAGSDGGERNPAGAPPCRYDPARDLFFRCIEERLYGAADNGMRRQNPAFPNPPISIPADGDGDDARTIERLRKRIDDIESGRAKMTFYTLDEHMRHLDKIWSG